MDTSILLLCCHPQRNDELCEERKGSRQYFICHLYTNRLLIKIHFGGSDWEEFVCEEKP